MFVFIYDVWVSMHGKDDIITHALVYAICAPDAEALLKQTEGIIDYEKTPVATFAQPTYIEPCVILERNVR